MTTQAKHDVFQALADPTRRSMLQLLAEKEMSIAEITDNYPISRTAVNKQLHILSTSGLVHSRKIGRETRFILTAEPLMEIQDYLLFFEHYWDDKLAALKKFTEEDS